jgi:hypothetical protein
MKICLAFKKTCDSAGWRALPIESLLKPLHHSEGCADLQSNASVSDAYPHWRRTAKLQNRQYICCFSHKIAFFSLIIQRVQNAEIGISHHSMDSQAPKKEHLMKSGIRKARIICRRTIEVPITGPPCNRKRASGYEIGVHNALCTLLWIIRTQNRRIWLKISIS